MSQPIYYLLPALLIVLFCSGCNPVQETAETEQTPSQSLPPGAGGLPPGAQPTPGAAEETGATPQGVPAQVGVGKKGDYGPGLITTPASAYWKAQEKIAFEVSIPKALELYKALDANGKGPADHATFMKQIIEANRIKLPELPEGQVYLYDPSTEQLMVVPARND